MIYIIIPLLNVEGGPIPSLLVANIEIPMVPFTTVEVQGTGIMDGTVHTLPIQAVAGMVRESQRILVVVSA